MCGHRSVGFWRTTAQGAGSAAVGCHRQETISRRLKSCSCGKGGIWVASNSNRRRETYSFVVLDREIRLIVQEEVGWERKMLARVHLLARCPTVQHLAGLSVSRSVPSRQPLRVPLTIGPHGERASRLACDSAADAVCVLEGHYQLGSPSTEKKKKQGCTA